MAASVSIEAFKDKLKYSELVSLVWGFVVSALFLTALIGVVHEG